MRAPPSLRLILCWKRTSSSGSSCVRQDWAGTYTYSYDTLSRLATLVNDGTTLVNNVTYGPADELLTIADLTLGGPTETRQYNVLGQLTSISMPLLVNLQSGLSKLATGIRAEVRERM